MRTKLISDSLELKPKELYPLASSPTPIFMFSKETNTMSNVDLIGFNSQFNAEDFRLSSMVDAGIDLRSISDSSLLKGSAFGMVRDIPNMLND